METLLKTPLFQGPRNVVAEKIYEQKLEYLLKHLLQFLLNVSPEEATYLDLLMVQRILLDTPPNDFSRTPERAYGISTLRDLDWLSEVGCKNEMSTSQLGLLNDLLDSLLIFNYRIDRGHFRYHGQLEFDNDFVFQRLKAETNPPSQREFIEAFITGRFLYSLRLMKLFISQAYAATPLHQEDSCIEAFDIKFADYRALTYISQIGIADSCLVRLVGAKYSGGWTRRADLCFQENGSYDPEADKPTPENKYPFEILVSLYRDQGEDRSWWVGEKRISPKESLEEIFSQIGAYIETGDISSDYQKDPVLI